MSTITVMDVHQGFPDYEPTTSETPVALYSFVLVYSLLSMILVGPLVIWGRIFERKRQQAAIAGLYAGGGEAFVPYDPTQERIDHDPHQQHPPPQHQDLAQPSGTQYPQHHQSQHPRNIEVPLQVRHPEQHDPVAAKLSGPKVDLGIDPLATGMPTSQQQAGAAAVVPVEGYPSAMQQQSKNSSFPRRRSRGMSGAAIFRGIDRVVTQNYPDEDPDFMSVVSGSRKSATGNNATGNSRSNHRRSGGGNAPSLANSNQTRANQSQGHNSNAPSAATTSRLYRGARPPNNPSAQPRAQIWDVSARRWKTRRPIGRVEVIQRAIQVETDSVGGGSSVAGGGSDLEQRTPLRPVRRNFQNGRRSRTFSQQSVSASGSIAGSRGPPSRSTSRTPSHAGSVRGGGGAGGSLSDTASDRLESDSAYGSSVGDHGAAAPRTAQRVVLEMPTRHPHYRLGPPPTSLTRPRHMRSTSFGSFGASSSGIATTVDNVTPDDAADADDPGRRNEIDEVVDPPVTVCCGPAALWTPRTLCMIVDGLIEVGEPDPEIRRIVGIAFPLTLGAMSERLFQAIMVAFVSFFVGTDSMVAYVLVVLLIGFTNELSGAVVDAESSLCSYALSTGQNFLAGQYVQAAFIWHSFLSIPVFVLWAFFMEDVVFWLVESESIASLAQSYAQVIVMLYFIQATARIFSTLFQLTGNELFETRFSIGEGIVNVITVSCVVALRSGSQLETVAWIQLLVGFASTIMKMAYAIIKGWFWPFWPGMSSCSLSVITIVLNLVITTIPLIIGALLEYGVWEVLLVCIVHLGPAEVAAWGILGIIWKLLETATEGIGEAAAIRVAYHLGMGRPEMAKHASHKAIFAAVVQALTLMSILFMGGKNISAWLTSDTELQLMLNDAMTYLGLGNLVMSYGMVTWALVGAQGRYRLATVTLLMTRWLVAIPMAMICIFGFRFDINSVVSGIIVGFATAGLVLAYVLFRSDWVRLSRILQELNALADEEPDEDEEDEEEGVEVGDEIVSLGDDDDDDDESSCIDYDARDAAEAAAAAAAAAGVVTAQ